MGIKSWEIAPGTEAALIPSDKFKSNCFSLNFQLPLSDEYITQANLLSAVLIRGCEKYKTSAELGRRIAMLYDPDIIVRTAKTPYALLFRVNAYFPDSRFIPSAESNGGTGDGNIFDEVAGLVCELLTAPLTENGGLSSVYVAGEKKNQIDNIRARINNKDSYAAYRCEKLTLGDIPFACDSLGTEKELEKATSESLYSLLRLILGRAKLLAVFAGNYGQDPEKKIERFILSLVGKRRAEDILPLTGPKMPVKPEYISEYAEEIDAVQSRLVLAYDMGDGASYMMSPESSASLAVFNEIFGSSAVSRLFLNVRERLNLCYYCSSVQQLSTGIMYVMSGISEENREQVIAETQRQLSGLCNPESISDEDISAAKENILGSYRTLPDSLVQYADWYISRAVSGRSTDTERYLLALESVTKADVAAVAARARLIVKYFLRGTGNPADMESGSGDTGEEETDE